MYLINLLFHVCRFSAYFAQSFTEYIFYNRDRGSCTRYECHCVTASLLPVKHWLGCCAVVGDVRRRAGRAASSDRGTQTAHLRARRCSQHPHTSPLQDQSVKRMGTAHAARSLSPFSRAHTIIVCHSMLILCSHVRCPPSNSLPRSRHFTNFIPSTCFHDRL